MREASFQLFEYSFYFSLGEFDVYLLNTDIEVMYYLTANCYAVYWYFMNIIFGCLDILLKFMGHIYKVVVPL